ncbi:hypothetical protein TSUD_95100 [Trifolium subterraneum]|uniref:Endonuclease/exonuclease/phosphatase domain-containing protein n=1 Tax=Trifolium subterraneum TaxID=3900 RepID=A0A2Z6MUR9_TRISU|nr:hypothetical protein TSUD_95100 [Trifolium subterraneum]
MIDCYVDCGDTMSSWRATGIYGYSKHHQKPMTCGLISDLYHTNHHDNWLLFGDFNLILNTSEKQGGRDTHYNSYRLFNNTLTNCDLLDLGYHGDKFTWTNNQENDNHIKDRLDRFCASPSWISKFPRCTNYHLLNYSSDHNPILLVFGTNLDFRDDSHAKTLIKRFENIWIKDPGCLQIIQSIWNHNNVDTSTKLQSVMEKVYQWGSTTFGHIPKEIKSIQTRITNLKV